MRVCYLCDFKHRGKEDPPIALHKFPSDPKTRSLWFYVCGLNEGIDIVKGVRICSKHFADKDISRKGVSASRYPLLIRGAVPSISVPCPLPLQDENSQDESKDKLQQFKVENVPHVGEIETVEIEGNTYYVDEIKTENEENKFIDDSQLDENVKRLDSGINFTDFPNICRVCLKGDNLVPIFCSYIMQLDMDVDKLLKECLQLLVSKNDMLPTNICTVCVNQLVNIYSFQKECMLNNSTLRTILISTPGIVKSEEFQESSGQTLEEVSSLPGTGKSPEKLQECFDYTDINHGENGVISTPGVFLTENSSSIKEINTAQENRQSSPTDYEDQTNISPSNNVKTNKLYVHTCKDCKKTFNSFLEVKMHRREAMHHVIRKKYTCPICHLSVVKMRQHMLVHTRGKPFKCKDCDKAFRFEPSLTRHVFIKHEKKKYVCEMCGEICSNLQILKRHRKRHSMSSEHEILSEVENVSLSCDLCGRNFSSKKLLRDHKYSHREKSCLCSKCGKVLKSHRFMWKHMRLHTGEKPFVCTVCGKSYATKSELNNHMGIHVGKHPRGKKLSCNECGKAFYTNYTLRQHQHIHGEKSFICNPCGKAFHTTSGLGQHMILHTSKRPHVCTTCKKSFRHKHTLSCHMLTHTGEKPFSCNICGLSFSQQGACNTHQKVHTGERPFTCDYCHRDFALKGNLIVHMRRHTGETPYLCRVCGKGYHDSSSRKKHEEKHHNDEA